MPQIEGDVAQSATSSAAPTEAVSHPRAHVRSASSASESVIGKPAATRQLTQPVAPSFMNRPKTTAASRLPPPAPARKTTAATAKTQELQSRLDALKKTAEQLRTKSVPKTTSSLRKPGERSPPPSPHSKTIDKKHDILAKNNVEETAAANGEEEEEERVRQQQLEARKKQEDEEEAEEARRRKQKEEEEELEAEKEREKARQIERAREEQARKDSLQQRAALALERNIAEERRVAEEKRLREIEEEINRRKLVEQEEELQAKQRKELQERERQRQQEKEEQELREQQRRKREEEEEAERRRQEQERALLAAAAEEREQLRRKLEQEEEMRRKLREEQEERERLELEARKRKQQQEEEERRRQEREEEERRKREKELAEERQRQREKELAEQQERIRQEQERIERLKQQELQREEERRKQELLFEQQRIAEETKRKEEEAKRKREREEEEGKRRKEKEEKRKREQEEEEREKQRREEERRRKEKAGREEREREEEEERKRKLQQQHQDNNNEPAHGLATVTKAKMAGGARKARTGFKFDATASTDVVKAPKPGEVLVQEIVESKPEPREEPAVRKLFMGVGIPGMAGLASQATAGLANLKRSGDRGAPKSSASRKGPFEVTFKAEGSKSAQVVAGDALDALDQVAKGHSWTILGFAEDVFTLMASGDDVGQAALDAMKPHLTPTNIAFLYFNSGHAEKDEGAAKCTEIMWQGEKTKLLVKARAGATRETLHLFTKRCFTIGIQKEASAHDDLDMTRIYSGGGEVSSPSISHAEPEVKPQPLTPSRPVAASGPPTPALTRMRTTEMKTPTNMGSNPLRPDTPWTGQEEIAKAVKEFLANEGLGAFFVLDIEGPKKNEVKVVASGVGALTDEWREKHCGATKCSVFVLKAENKEAGYVSLEKIVYVQWVGRQVKILEKGRAKEIYAGLKEFVREQCGTLAGEFEVLEGQAQDVNIQAVTECITGSRQRGATAVHSTAKKVERATGAPVDLSYADEEGLRKIISDISEEKQTWVAVTYSEEKAATLELLGSGVGENVSISWGKEPTPEHEAEQNKRDQLPDTPTAQYKKYCKSSNIVFIVHRFLRIPEQFQFSKDMGSYAKSHFGLMMWQGADCRVMDKAASSHHWKDFCSLVRDVMEKAGVYVEAGVYVATKLEEVNPRDIRKGMRMDMY